MFEMSLWSVIAMIAMLSAAAAATMASGVIVASATSCEVTEPSTEPPVDQPLAVDQVDELNQNHQPQAGSEIVIDAQSVPSVPSPVAVTHAEKFANEFLPRSQESIALAMAVDSIVHQARTAITQEASRISEFSGFGPH